MSCRNERLRRDRHRSSINGGTNGSSLGGGNNPNGAAGGGGGYLSSGYGYALPYGATGGSGEGFNGGIAGLVRGRLILACVDEWPMPSLLVGTRLPMTANT